MAKVEETHFEEVFRKLEHIVETLESGESSLEESLVLYEKGMALAQWCTEKLDDAELRLEKLVQEKTRESVTEQMDD